jgi:hypothetical protein
VCMGGVVAVGGVRYSHTHRPSQTYFTGVPYTCATTTTTSSSSSASTSSASSSALVWLPPSSRAAGRVRVVKQLLRRLPKLVYRIDHSSVLIRVVDIVKVHRAFVGEVVEYV